MAKRPRTRGVPLNISTITAVERIVRELEKLGVAQLTGCCQELTKLVEQQQELRRQHVADPPPPRPTELPAYAREAICGGCGSTLTNAATLKRHKKTPGACGSTKSLGKHKAKKENMKETHKKENKDKKKKKNKKKSDKKKKPKLYKLDRVAARSPAAADIVRRARFNSGGGLPYRVKAEILVDVACGNKIFHLEAGLEAMFLQWDEHICLYTPSVGFVILRLERQPLKVHDTTDGISHVHDTRGSVDEMNTLDLSGVVIPDDKDSMQTFYSSVMGAASSSPATLLRFVLVSSFLKPDRCAAE